MPRQRTQGEYLAEELADLIANDVRLLHRAIVYGGCFAQVDGVYEVKARLEALVACCEQLESQLTLAAAA